MFAKVNPVDKTKVKELERPDKVIIASHSTQHCSDLLSHGSEGVDILIEKPLFPAFVDFESLPDTELRRIFVNLEFYNAYFISDFSDEIKLLDLDKIEIVWHDPLIENRGAEESKCSEVFSSIFLDQLLHVTSICKALKVKTGNFKIFSIASDNHDSPGSIEISCDLDGVTASISLSRFANARERKIIINDGAASLDFSSGPIFHRNGAPPVEIAPSNRLYPVARTLTDFMNYPESENAFLLSLKSLLPEIKFCFACEDLFVDYMAEQLASNKMTKCNAGKVHPRSVYYAGILYYRQIVNSISDSEIQYLKGNNGVQELLRWLQKDHTVI
ncbi:MAG: hypothetical protein HOH25_07370 [Opitutae bacterium]|nr:hypothetical protein [Opitutae bacterium]